MDTLLEPSQAPGRRRGGAYALATTGHKQSLSRHSLLTTMHQPPPRLPVALLTVPHPRPNAPWESYAALTSGCPQPDPRPRQPLAQAFDEAALDRARRDADVNAIVHHGPAVDLPGFDLRHSHTELLAVFARRDTPVESISVARVIDGLARGTDLGDSGRPILRHAGELNRRALAYALEQVGVGIPEPERKHAFGSYAELANSGTRACGPLIIGLRGLHLRRPDLKAVRLDGYCPLARSTHERYPLKYEVHFYMRKDQSEPFLAISLAYLHIIKLRMSLDNNLFSEQGGLVH